MRQILPLLLDQAELWVTIYSSMRENRAGLRASVLPPYLLLVLSLFEIFEGCENSSH